MSDAIPHLVSLRSWSGDDIRQVVEAALRLKTDPGAFRQSLAGQSLALLFHLVDAQYLPAAVMADADARYRALSRAQMELIAGRVSSINGCFY